MIPRSRKAAEDLPLTSGWVLALTPSGSITGPAALAEAAPDGVGLDWIPAQVPGTVAGALRAAGRWDGVAGADSAAPLAPLDQLDVWYQCPLQGEGAFILHCEGLATLAEIWLDDQLLLYSQSMYQAHEVPVQLQGQHRLTLCFRALGPVAAKRRGRRARWRSPMIAGAELRGIRTTLLGHMPGWCPAVPAVGPYRPMFLRPAEHPAPHIAAFQTGWDTTGGWATIALEFPHDLPAELNAQWRIGGIAAPLALAGPRRLEGAFTALPLAPWWPHTHGAPNLHAAQAEIEGTVLDLGQIGFRSVVLDRGVDGRGFAVQVNGAPVFCRGASWISPDLAGLPATPEAYRPWLEAARDIGMNMLRVPGTALYEGRAFHQLCDQLGIMVWQDFMFANMDYPAEDPDFQASVTIEAEQLLRRLQASPSLTVLCGGSEVAQQCAMMGQPPAAWTSSLFSELLPAAVERICPGIPYVTNSPSAPPGDDGSALPFATSSGVTHYYGVGAYRRDFSDTRRARVHFAAECLAFAQIPDACTLAAIGSHSGRDIGQDKELTQPLGQEATRHPIPGNQAWKASVPRDAGASWDFEDVRDHYLATLFAEDADALRQADPARYIALSRLVPGMVMEQVYAEWRRPGSGCSGGLVWTLQDLAPGNGWGLIGAGCRPKDACFSLHRAFRPLQLLVTDEGLDGLGIHVVNETTQPFTGRLRIRCLREGRIPVCQGECEVFVNAHDARSVNSSSIIGRFFDITYAYRFGNIEHDVSVVTLLSADGATVLAEATHLPSGASALGRVDMKLGLSLQPETAQASATPGAGASGPHAQAWRLTLAAERFFLGVQLQVPGFRADDSGFHLSPGQTRSVLLMPEPTQALPSQSWAPQPSAPQGSVWAVNATAPVSLPHPIALPLPLPERFS